MRVLRFAILFATLGIANAAYAKTVVVFVEPMTLDKHARVFDTPGPDRMLVCMQPPSLSGCREVTAKKRD